MPHGTKFQRFYKLHTYRRERILWTCFKKGGLGRRPREERRLNCSAARTPASIETCVVCNGPVGVSFVAKKKSSQSIVDCKPSELRPFQKRESNLIVFVILTRIRRLSFYRRTNQLGTHVCEAKPGYPRHVLETFESLQRDQWCHPRT